MDADAKGLACTRAAARAGLVARPGPPTAGQTPATSTIPITSYSFTSARTPGAVQHPICQTWGNETKQKRFQLHGKLTLFQTNLHNPKLSCEPACTHTLCLLHQSMTVSAREEEVKSAPPHTPPSHSPLQNCHFSCHFNVLCFQISAREA